MKILEQLRRHAMDAPDRIAVREVSTNRTITYSTLANAAADFAKSLSVLPPNSAIIVRHPNFFEFHGIFLAALLCDRSVFPVSPEIALKELDRVADQVGASGVVHANGTIKALATSRQFNWTNPSLLLQSSGTTGLPKVVRRTANAIDAIAQNVVNAVDMTSSDQILSCVPLCHSYGLEHGLLAPIFAGATVHLAHGFDLATIRRELGSSSISLFPTVPSICEMLGNLPEGGGIFPSLRAAYCAGAPLPLSVYHDVEKHFGIRIAQLYGTTEFGSATLTRPEEPHFEPASVGRPMNGVQMRVEDGELLAKSPTLMSEYVGETQSPFTADGSFPTGDLARIDAHGNVFITGRSKLLIDVGGLKVNPIEVEQAICEHAAVSACVVVPVRASRTVFRLKAIITPADPAHPPEIEELRRFARERLTSYKVPRTFEFRAELPRSATGKVLRHLLVETA